MASDWLVGGQTRRLGKREIALVQGQHTHCPYTIAAAAVSLCLLWMNGLPPGSYGRLLPSLSLMPPRALSLLKPMPLGLHTMWLSLLQSASLSCAKVSSILPLKSSLPGSCTNLWSLVLLMPVLNLAALPV